MNTVHTAFGFRSTASEVLDGVDLSGRRAVVTGASSGIGVETARALAAAGADVVLAVRDPAAGERTAAAIGPRASAAVLDLADLESVRAFVAAWDGPLDILVNNAGIMATPEQHTPQGWELQFAVNHLGHFALTTGLHQYLAAAGDARVVAVSSSAHQGSPVIFDDLHFVFRHYDPGLAYAQAKTANVLFAVGASARWAGDGITANSLMPGAISTGLQRHSGGFQNPPEEAKTVEQGAATSVLLAGSPLLVGVGGRYFVDCNEAEVLERRSGDMSGVARYAIDPANAERLWEVSEELTRG